MATSAPTHRSSPAIRRGGAAALIGALAIGLAGPEATAQAPSPSSPPPPRAPVPAGQVAVPIRGDSLGGFVLPVQPLAEALSIRATRAWAWTVDDTQRLQLAGDVAVEIGSYRFRAAEAIAWINRIPSAQGTITQFALYFEEASEPTQRAGLSAGGRDLLVTGSTRGGTTLGVASIERRAPPRSVLRSTAEQRLAQHLQTLLAAPPRLAARPRLDRPTVPEVSLEPGGPPPSTEQAFPELPREIVLPRPDLENVPIFAPGGVLSFSAKRVQIEEGDDAVIAEGGVLIDYTGSGPAALRRLELAADRAVIFTSPGSMASIRAGQGSIDVSSVAGIYLEGGVSAFDGNYTFRAERIYYDLPNNQALAVDAVLRTYIRLRQTLPVYARAREMRQVAANQWTAQEAVVSTSEFFTPHLALGMQRVTITEDPDGTTRLDGRHATIRAGGFPFFYWPRLQGTADRIPLSSIRVGYENDRGVEIETRWDLFSLMGIEPPGGVEGDLIVNGYTARGAGLGTRFRWSDLGGDAWGLDLYGLYESAGQDKTDAGITQTSDSDRLRGIAAGEFNTRLSGGPTGEIRLRGQVAWISDESFVATWRRIDYRQRREYETSLDLTWNADHTQLELYGKYDLNSFISNSWLLASRGYFVDRFPAVEYQRIGDSLFGDSVTWTSSYGYDYMRLVVTSGTAQSLGVRPGTFSTANRNAEVRDLYFADGYRDDSVMRFNTRQELALPLEWGPVKMVPYAWMQLSAYLEDEVLKAYSPEADSWRFLGGAGARMSATFTRVHDGVRSRVLDLDRLRQVVEPYATFWYGYDSLPKGSLPVYDQTVEGATGALAAQVGLRQRWQTQRGGPGNWRSVDWITLDLGAVFNQSSDNFQPDPLRPQRVAQSPIPRFFAWRPELSQWGSNVYGSATWELSDSFTLAGKMIYMLEDRDLITRPGALRNLALGSIGFSMVHSPQVRSFLEYRYLAPDDTEILQGGLAYQISRKYALQFSPQYDIKQGDFRAISGSIERTFPDFNLSLAAGYDLILDEVSVSLNLSLPAVTRTRFGLNPLDTFGQ